MEFKQLQNEQKEWSLHNFGDQPAYFALLGIIEEAGELCHAHLKTEQNIRGDSVQHFLDKQDAIADIIIYLADYCWRSGIDLDLVVRQTWDAVKQRDWKAFPKNGVSE
jgi:NTP pyrophosphatase (non-canonical NTP hydrolase)